LTNVVFFSDNQWINQQTGPTFLAFLGGRGIKRTSAWCKVSVFFFRMDTPSTNKTKKFNPYHLKAKDLSFFSIMA
jgi:hypothetical protein